MAETTIRGKIYEYRTEFLGREGWQAFTEIMRLMPNSVDDVMDGYDNTVTALSKLITAWDHEGDPADPAAWEQISAPDILILYARVNQDIADNTAKN